MSSQTQAFIPRPGSSQDNLCIGGASGFYRKNLVYSGASGQFSLQSDLPQTPTPSGPVWIQPAETWDFQAWYRNNNPTRTST
jgi:hypothetical protein